MIEDNFTVNIMKKLYLVRPDGKIIYSIIHNYEIIRVAAKEARKETQYQPLNYLDNEGLNWRGCSS